MVFFHIDFASSLGVASTGDFPCVSVCVSYGLLFNLSSLKIFSLTLIDDSLENGCSQKLVFSQILICIGQLSV